MTEAVAEEESGGKSDEARVQETIDEALACTCVSDLKEGPCGGPFVEAFSCFIKSQQPKFEDKTDCSVGFAELKVSDKKRDNAKLDGHLSWYPSQQHTDIPSLTLRQECMIKHPEQFEDLADAFKPQEKKTEEGK